MEFFTALAESVFPPDLANTLSLGLITDRRSKRALDKGLSERGLRRAFFTEALVECSYLLVESGWAVPAALDSNVTVSRSDAPKNSCHSGPHVLLVAFKFQELFSGNLRGNCLGNRC